MKLSKAPKVSGIQCKKSDETKPVVKNTKPKSLKFEKGKNGYKFINDDAALDQSLVATFHCDDRSFSVSQALHLLNVGGACDTSETSANGMLAFVHSMEARDEIEALLLTQMASVHHLAMICMRRAANAKHDGQVDLNLNQANKLSRTFTTQMEALNRHRGKGQQKVTVEHVTVNSGGQAIVGSVEQSPKGGGESGK